MGIVTAWYILSTALAVAGQLVESLRWMSYATVMTAYRPQTMVAWLSEGVVAVCVLRWRRCRRWSVWADADFAHDWDRVLCGGRYRVQSTVKIRRQFNCDEDWHLNPPED